MPPEWTMLREPEDFSGLPYIAPEECVYGLGPDFGTPGVVHLRADRLSARRTCEALTDWGVDLGDVRVIEWPGDTADVVAAIAPAIQRLTGFVWYHGQKGARWFPLRPEGPRIVEIADGPEASRFARHMEGVALVVVGYLALPSIKEVLEAELT